MELLNINSIKQLDDGGLHLYIEALSAEYGWDIPTIYNIIDEIHSDRAKEIPLSQISLDYLITYLITRYRELDSYEIYEQPFCDNNNIFIMYWKRRGVERCTFINSIDKVRLKDILLLLNAGEEPEIPQDTFSGEEWEQHREYMTYLCHQNTEVIPSIPKEVLQVEDNTARFSSAIWYDRIREKNILLAGCGGIGSYVAFLLSRMHPKSLVLYDDDSVEEVNMAGQLFSSADIGRHKVTALASLMNNYSMYYSYFIFAEKFDSNSTGTDIMICGFDSMKARRDFFENWKALVDGKDTEEEKKKCLFIDGRLAAEELQVFCIRGDDEYYKTVYFEKYLFSDEEADATVCSYKQTSYMANMIGSIIVNLFTNFVANEIIENLRELPFITTYNGESMMFKTMH